MRKIWMLGAAALLIIGAVAMAQDYGRHGMRARGGAQGMHMRHGGPGMHGGGMDRHFEYMADELDLTAAQKEAAQKLHQAMREQADAVFTQERAIHEAMGELLDAANPDAAAIGQKVIEAHALRGRLKTLHETTHQEFKALLNAEQVKKFEQLESERPRFRGMGGPCMYGNGDES
jgi:Spy/CpxP family protein refolding chaperone